MQKTLRHGLRKNDATHLVCQLPKSTSQRVGSFFTTQTNSRQHASSLGGSGQAFCKFDNGVFRRLGRVRIHAKTRVEGFVSMAMMTMNGSVISALLSAVRPKTWNSSVHNPKAKWGMNLAGHHACDVTVTSVTRPLSWRRRCFSETKESSY